MKLMDPHEFIRLAGEKKAFGFAREVIRLEPQYKGKPPVAEKTPEEKPAAEKKSPAAATEEKPADKKPAEKKADKKEEE